MPMRFNAMTASAALLLTAPSVCGFTLGNAAAPLASHRAPAATMFFDKIAKAFENQEYGTPREYEQTNARASHILVASEEQANDIKAKLASGELDFAGAAMSFSTCNSASKGGKLGKFNPGSMVAEFDDVVFGLYDTGELNPKNDAALFKPKYEEGIVHGPVKTKFGYHLIKIDSRYIADFDFRLKEQGVVEI